MADPLFQRIRDLSRPLAPEPAGVTPALRVLPVKAVLFDVYGTMFVSGSGDIGVTAAADSAQAAYDALTSAGAVPVGPEAGSRAVSLYEDAVRSDHERRRRDFGTTYPEVVVEDLWQAVVERLADDGLIACRSPAAALAARTALEYECRVNPVWPMPHLKETLAGLRQRCTYLGIVSNSQFYTEMLFPALVKQSLEQLGFTAELCVWSYREGQGKPALDLYHKAGAGIAKAGIAAAETLFIGNDMLNDIWCAAQCGFRTALFAGDRRSLRRRENDDRCRELQPDLVLTDLRQIVSCVGSVDPQTIQD